MRLFSALERFDHFDDRTVAVDQSAEHPFLTASDCSALSRQDLSADGDIVSHGRMEAATGCWFCWFSYFSSTKMLEETYLTSRTADLIDLQISVSKDGHLIKDSACEARDHFLGLKRCYVKGYVLRDCEASSLCRSLKRHCRTRILFPNLPTA